jgi:NADPH:quinone reductase-like Zn-dependent oxidoreductase
MKAIVYTEYGTADVLQLKDVAKPTPKDDEVLVKVYAVSANAADIHLLKADPFLMRLSSGFLKPKYQILGSDIAGRVEAVGKNITEFKPGDDVFGDISAEGWGGFAEYVCVHENALALKPANLSFEEAAAVPMAAVTALQGFHYAGQLQQGKKVLINGASGGVGTFAVQLAKAFGAEVTAVCSTRNLDVARSIGADHVIDYTREDFAANGKKYDLILATNGNRSISDYRRALSPKGTYVHTGGSMTQMTQAMIQGPWFSRARRQKMGSMGVTKPNKKDLLILKELLESGKVKPVIDRCYPLNEAADAIRYLEEGHAQGKVVIIVTQNN